MVCWRILLQTKKSNHPGSTKFHSIRPCHITKALIQPKNILYGTLKRIKPGSVSIRARHILTLIVEYVCMGILYKAWRNMGRMKSIKCGKCVFSSLYRALTFVLVCAQYKYTERKQENISQQCIIYVCIGIFKRDCYSLFRSTLGYMVQDLSYTISIAIFTL